MAVSKTGFEAATGTYSTNGAAIAAGTGETATSVGVTNTSTLVTDTSVKSTGAQSMRIAQAASSLAFVKTATGMNTPTGAGDVEFLQTGLTGNKPPSSSEFYLLQARASTGNLYSLTWLTTGFLRVRTTGSNNLWTSTTAFSPTVFTRIAMAVRLDTTTAANSQFRVAALPVGSDTPISGIDSGWVTAAPATTGANLDFFYGGRLNGDADTTPMWIDNFRWDPAANDLITSSSTTFAISGSLSPANPQLYTQQRTLTLTASGSNGNAITYGPIDWGDSTTSAAQAATTNLTTTFTHTYPSMANGAANANYTISATATQAG